MTTLIIMNEEMNKKMNDVMKIVNPLKESDFITFILLLAKHLKMKQETTRGFLGMLLGTLGAKQPNSCNILDEQQ